MDLPFLGMIAAFGFPFAPRGWALCAGQIISLAQNSALFALLGTYYGGNGQSTFALPDLQGRVPVGQGNGPGLTPKTMGERAGTETFTLTINELPAHNHVATSNITPAPQGAIVAGNATSPENNYLALSPKIGSGPNATILKTYATPAAASAVAGDIKPIAGNVATAGTAAVGVTGNNLPIRIVQPYLTINYSIATQGIFPSRN